MPNYCCNAVGCSNSTLKQKNVEKYPWLKDVKFHSLPHATGEKKNDSCRFQRFGANRTGPQTSFHGYVPNTS